MTRPLGRILSVQSGTEMRVDGFMSIGFTPYVDGSDRGVQVTVYDGQRLIAVGIASPESARLIAAELTKVTTRAMYVAQA